MGEKHRTKTFPSFRSRGVRRTGWLIDHRAKNRSVGVFFRCFQSTTPVPSCPGGELILPHRCKKLTPVSRERGRCPAGTEGATLHTLHSLFRERVLDSAEACDRRDVSRFRLLLPGSTPARFSSTSRDPCSIAFPYQFSKTIVQNRDRPCACPGHGAPTTLCTVFSEN